MWHKESTVDFSKLNGLIPAVVQDDESNEVLMVGFMNEEALERTKTSGFATFFSRTRDTHLDEGRNLRQPVEGPNATHRL